MEDGHPADRCDGAGHPQAPRGRAAVRTIGAVPQPRRAAAGPCWLPGRHQSRGSGTLMGESPWKLGLQVQCSGTRWRILAMRFPLQHPRPGRQGGFGCVPHPEPWNQSVPRISRRRTFCSEARGSGYLGILTRPCGSARTTLQLPKRSPSPSPRCPALRGELCGIPAPSPRHNVKETRGAAGISLPGGKTRGEGTELRGSPRAELRGASPGPPRLIAYN